MSAELTGSFLPHAFFVWKLLDRVGFASGAGFVTFDVVTGQEDSVTGYDFAWFEEGDIAYDNVLGYMNRQGGGKVKGQLVKLRHRDITRHKLTLMLMTLSKPPRITFTVLSSFFSFNALNCFSFCQSFTEPTMTTIATAPIIATPSREVKVSPTCDVDGGIKWTDLQPNLQVVLRIWDQVHMRTFEGAFQNLGKDPTQGKSRLQQTTRSNNTQTVISTNVCFQTIWKISKIHTKTLSFIAIHINSNNVLLFLLGSTFFP